jgi:hypothetical protein
LKTVENFRLLGPVPDGHDPEIMSDFILWITSLKSSFTVIRWNSQDDRIMLVDERHLIKL